MTSPTGATTPSRRSLPADLLRAWLVAAVVITIDQATKYWAATYLRPVGGIEVLDDWVRLIYTTNTGAAFGLLQNANLLFALVALIVVPLLIIYRAYLPVGDRIRDLVLGLLLGGALGNLIDRLRQGFVTDFIDVGVGTLRWPTFNVADSSFVIGAAIIILWSIFSPQHQAMQNKSYDGRQ